MDPSSQIERIILAVDEFLHALDTRSWPTFEACFARSATVSLSDVPEEPDDLLSWQYIRQGWRQVFTAELSRIGPVDPNHRRPVIQLNGSRAFVSFTAGDRRSRDDQAIVMGLVDGRWLIRHLHVARLPLRTVAAAAARPSEPVPVAAAEPGSQAWFVPVLVTALIAVALLGTLGDRRSALQISAAVLAVFVGAVTILRGEVGTWQAGARNAPLSSSGALGLAVGAAFLIT